jgi:dimethylargininase
MLMRANPMMASQVTHALARKVSRSLARCELLHVPRQSFDLAIAERQHAAYVEALEALGITVTLLPEEPDLPDAAFVEDLAVVLDEMAVICRPSTASRQREVSSIESEIARTRTICKITEPGTVEGGDVLRMGKALYVGHSTRTNAEGIRQLERLVKPHGYQVVRVNVSGCLHLKTAVTSPAGGVVVANADWVDLSPFQPLEILSVPGEEPWAANTLAINGTVFVPSSCPRTARQLEAAGLKVKPIDISELQKAEAGLTCLSVLYAGFP